MSKSKIVFLSSLKMAIATFLSRVLGLVREQAIAFYFGASGLTDAFYVAFRIPNFFRDLLAEGALSSAFVPNFIQAKKESLKNAKWLLWSLFIVIMLITTLISLLIIFNAHNIVGFIAPSFSKEPDKFELTILLTKTMAPFLVFISASAIFMGALNSMGVFFIPAVSPTIFSISIITSLIVLPTYFSSKGIPAILSLGVGALLGGFFQACLQFTYLWKNNLSPSFKNMTKLHPKTLTVVGLLGPGLMGFAATQANLIVNTILATGTVVGAVSFLNYGFRLFQLPVGILSVSIGNSNLVHFSSSWRSSKKSEAISIIQSSNLLSWFVILPATTISLLFSEEIVHLIFERGQFDRQSTIMTGKALFWYASGLPFYGLYKIFVPAFYVIERQMTPVLISIASVIFNILFCVLLTPIYGFEVLALGTSLSILLNALSLIVLFSKTTNTMVYKFLNFRVLKLVLCAVLTFTFAFKLKQIFSFYDLTTILKCIYLLFFFSLSAILYFILVFLAGERHQVLSLVSKLKDKFSRK